MGTAAGFSDRRLQHNVRGVAGNQGRNGRGPQRRQPSRVDIEFERMLLARHGRLRRRNRKRRSILLFGALLLASIIALVLATVAFTGQQILLSQCNPPSSARSRSARTRSSTPTTGRLLGVVPSATNRQPLPLSQISPSLPEATVAIEDARFWQHGALDYQGIARALYQDVSKGHIVQGGSTITQELVRNLYIGNSQRTLSRKVKEACLATKFFEQKTRKQILADYLNEVFYGQARVRRAGGRADVLLEARLEADARPGGAARRPAAGADGVRPAQQSARRARPPERGAARDVEERLHHRVEAAERDAEEARAQAGPPLHAAAPAELLRLGDAAAPRAPRQARPAAGGARRPQGQDDARHAPAGARRPRGQLGPAQPDRSRRGDRVHRPADRRREGDGRLPAERAEDAVQPRDAGSPVDGQRLQADHPRDRVERGRLDLLDLLRPARAQHHHAGVHAGQRVLGRSTTSPTRRRAR